MGRPRIHNKGLPVRVYLSHGSYFFRPKAGRTVNLGREFAQAMAEYGRLMHGAWSPALRDAVSRAKALPPQLPGTWLVRTRQGRRYSESGFSALWQRVMAKWVATGGERFTFHDIRAKTASDKTTLGGAAALLGHASSDTTRRVYRRGGETVEPLK